jgi:hypothetical protein
MNRPRRHGAKHTELKHGGLGGQHLPNAFEFLTQPYTAVAGFKRSGLCHRV